MAKIFRTKNQPTRFRMLLRAGLSIFLFLQIHKPDAAVSPVNEFSHLTIQEVKAERKAELNRMEKIDTAQECAKQIALLQPAGR